MHLNLEKECVMKAVTRISAILAISAASYGLAFAQSSPSPQAPMPKPAAGAKADVGEGVIKSVDAAAGTVTFASGQTLKVKDPAAVSKLKEGQIIEYRTEAGDGGPVIVAMKVLG
jgi:Cu/Ag efflux protein CusF